MKTKRIVHLYRRRRDSETDLKRDAYQGQVLPADLQDFNNHNGYQRSQVLISRSLNVVKILKGSTELEETSNALVLLKVSCSYPMSLIRYMIYRIVGRVECVLDLLLL